MRISRKGATRRATLAAVLGICAAGALPASGAAAITFETHVHAGGSFPASVAIGDFNDDGAPDLVTTNAVPGGYASVLTNDGSGLFLATEYYSGGGAYPRSVAVGDFDEDGLDDIAVANSVSGHGNVSVQVNAGGGAFSSTAVQNTVADWPYSIAAADLDDDHHLDLVTANPESDNVSVLLGNGDGSFGSATNFSAGAVPVAVAVGDLGGDGNLDLVTANWTSNEVRILNGDGTGDFSSGDSAVAGGLPAAVAVARVDGDTDLDVLIANSASDDVSLLRGNGDGTVQAPTSFVAGDLPTSVASGDFNGDGNLDIAATNWSSNDVSILLGDGSGSFGPTTSFPVGRNPYSIVVEDLNADGAPDLATADFESRSVSVLLNTSAEPALTLRPTAIDFGTQLPGATGPRRTVTIDNDGPGKLRISDLQIVGPDADDFRIKSEGCAGYDFPAGDSCPINMTFAPGGPGGRSAELRVVSNDPNSPHTVALTGSGEVPICADRDATIIGTAGADLLHGTTGADVVALLGGDDTFTGGTGEDIICGGGGDDLINGRSGDDDLRGGSGDDEVLGGTGADHVLGRSGGDELHGGDGRDECRGGSGQDSADVNCETTVGVP